MKDIDVILPCYNPSPDFAIIVGDYFKNLKASFPDRNLNLIVVNDGSTRNFSESQIRQLYDIENNVLIISYPVNKGKGYALRKAIEQTNSHLVLYTDYDFPFDIQSIKKLINELDKGTDVVLASRNHDYIRTLPLQRKFYSLLIQLFNRIFLGMEFYDAQGGLKGFNSRGKEIFMQTRIDEFLFDTEFIYRASLKKDVAMVNIKGITRQGIKPSRIPLKVIVKETYNFLRILKLKAE